MRNLILTFIFIGTSLVLIILFVGVQKSKGRPDIKQSEPHLYGDERSSLKNIKITIFYFIPKDVISKKNDTWKEKTEQQIKKLQDFHNLQFKNTSKITYEFYPEVIVGGKTTQEYESVLKNEDKDALPPVKEEIIHRAFTQEGNLYEVAQKNKEKDTRNVYLVIFEGNGAAGNDDFALISRSYITDDIYQENGTTFLAHEFYHTLGIPDNYQKSVYVYNDNKQIDISLLTEEDIMGKVILPLKNTYINIETLKKMGL